MKIGIAGLGLIGGSMAKAIKANTAHRVIGYDIDSQVLCRAREEGAIDCIGTQALLGTLDLLLVALYPEQTVRFVRERAAFLRPGCAVIDLCGVKTYVCKALGPFCAQQGLLFIGGHPMAGREFSGYGAAQAELFQGASMLLVPGEAGDAAQAEAFAPFFRQLGFTKVVVTTAETHDRMIAFTSQLAHIVSNAYVKSPEAEKHDGYSAGSYKDLTRVARLNETMWSELFLCNREALIDELDCIIGHLQEYRFALETEDRDTLQRLLKEGSDRKKRIDREGE
ncbi:MAG TPA: prephenate dehydrogenase/arogenate dehydrogenase family protein [Candidatus Fimivicinus intestinavium]|nr:prephenate dehydrogenase/arogenate dehydrogenase family protein [Candidatus Fimivicinus intestinavium]